MSLILGNEGNTRAKNGDDYGGADTREETIDDEKAKERGPAPNNLHREVKVAPEREGGATITGEDTSTRGSDGVEGRGGQRSLHQWDCEKLIDFEGKRERMCGIGLIVAAFPRVSEGRGPSASDLITALKKRGPDHVGCESSQVSLEEARIQGDAQTEACHGDIQETLVSKVALEFIGSTLQLRGSSPAFQPLRDSQDNILVYNGEIFGGLEIKSEDNDTEYLMSALLECCTCLCHVHSTTTQSCKCSEESLKKDRKDHKDHISVLDLLSSIRGPWAVIYWQAESKTLWFGRDALGRRSLLIHWPSPEDEQLTLSSTASFPSKRCTDPSLRPSEKDSSCFTSCNTVDEGDIETRKEGEFAFESEAFEYWEELPCTIHSITFGTLTNYSHADDDSSRKCHFGSTIGYVMKHDWKDSFLTKLLEWERDLANVNKDSGLHNKQPNNVMLKSSLRKCTSPQLGDEREKEEIADEAENRSFKIYREEPREYSEVIHGLIKVERPLLMESTLRVLAALWASVKRRTICSRKNVEMLLGPGMETYNISPVAILFSGGLDSMILAALADKCIDPHCGIDLLNVSFEGSKAPDRLSALAGVQELREISPMRRWRLVEVDGTHTILDTLRPHILSLICPSKTYMDLNIGLALWLAASGNGQVDDGVMRRKYISNCPILLLGTGADEQCAGYSRHRTKFRSGRWEALQEEMRLDMQRLWKRNLGRDDRCISDQGKEARFPFLDEDVIQTLLSIPLWEIADLEKPLGQGDKKILREVALHLGLKKAATLPKRAIQFGSRIARESNKSYFGSNRAANQASAGSAVIHLL